MKTLILGLLLCFAAQATITQAQQVTSGNLCSGTTGTSCAVNVTATQSGSILVAMFAAGPTGVTNVTDNKGNTWLHAPNCHIANVDCWFALNSIAGATTVTGTVASNSGRSVEFYEFKIGPGCFAYYDNSFSAITNSGTSQPGIALTLSGTDDVIVQQILASASISSVDTPISGYVDSASPGSNNRIAAYLVTPTSAFPTWTLSTASTADVNAIAFQEACSVSITISPTQTTMYGSQIQQFTATVEGIQNTAVTWSISGSLGGDTISNAGLYTAPPPISTAQTVTVTAKVTNAPTIMANATITIPAGTVVDSYSLSELFGVAWPDQPIEFRYLGTFPLPSPLRMVGPLGAEVAFQWVSSLSCMDTTAPHGCVVVRSNLPIGANYNWTLLSGVAPSATQTNPVAINPVGNNLEITNGLTGVRIACATTTPACTVNGNPSSNLAPIQGICYVQNSCPGANSWTGGGAVLLSQSANFLGNVGEPSDTPLISQLNPSYSVTVVDSGPMKTVVNVTYTFTRPVYKAGNIIINNANSAGSPGSGHYTTLVTVYANSKSVLIDEDTDMQFTYSLPVFAQLTPDTARWRGADSVDNTGVSNPICGYESPLTVLTANGASVVVGTATSHNLSNGQPVTIAGVVGNAAANGTFYAKTIGFSSTAFGLYHNQNLTVPVVGAGTGSLGTVKPAYRGQVLVPEEDAFQDLTYTGARPAGYSCATNSYRKLLADYPPASHGAGWYVELYKSGAGAAAPVVGFYVGRASKQSYSATGPSLPGIYSTSPQAAGIQVDTLLRGPDGSTPCGNTTTGFSPCEAVIHRNWGIFVSKQADLKSPALHQPIADEQNMLTGINLSRLYTYQLVYPDPPGGWQWLYLTAASAATLESWVENGTSVCGTPTCYATLLNNSEGSAPGQALVSMWEGNSSAAVQTALNSAAGLAKQLVSTLVSGDNHFDNALGYYQLGLKTSPGTALLNAILMNANTTPAQKTLAKAALALFGSIFWDDDWFPIDNNSGESDGLANQIQQYLEYRAQSVFSNSSQPFLSQQLATATTYATNDLANYFDATGAAAGSTHYQSAFFEPLILNYMNPATQGSLSLSDPKWANYANWELSIQTPPEPRFGNVRKGYSNGDGNTEADVRTGMLATALNTITPPNPANTGLVGNLMWAWQQSNGQANGQNTLLTEDGEFVTTLAVIDPTIPAVAPGTGGTPPLGSINVPGYHSVERFNFGTPNETVLWFINGGFYSPGGHRHADDGQVSIYALSAPLAIDWNPNLYYPEVGGRIMHNSMVYDSELSPSHWSDDQLPLGDVSNWFQTPTNTEFASFANSTTSTGRFTAADGSGNVWLRTVRTMNFNPLYPVIYVNDTFQTSSGSADTSGKTVTWNLMAVDDGMTPVTTPAGPIIPTTRFNVNPGCNETVPSVLPSNGTIEPANSFLPVGLNQFKFTGAVWLQHATQGINWDLFMVAPNSSQQKFLIGNWGHGCHSSRETTEYENANRTNSFAEVQHILRVHDNVGGPFSTIIMPYQKGNTPTRTVTQQACGVQVLQGTETTCFNGSMATYAGRRSRMFTVYDTSTQSAYGFTASGGPQEVVVQSDQVVWTISGAGQNLTRTLTLPGTWYPNPAAGVTRSGNTFSYTFTGGQQAAPVTITFSQLP